ncbi:MAG: hypothetical protein IPH12_21945 [Saprospirales bacterium]|nr:hypothetical protein [Saprospirales bacterium]MBK8920509.1 hypothetical protein [Saprospirales bacterium]
MAEQTKKPEPAKPGDKNSMAVFLGNFSDVIDQLCESYRRKLGEENPDEWEMLSVFCGMLKTATQGVEKEMGGIYAELDTDSKNLLNRHLDNSGVIGIQTAAIQFLKNNGNKSKIELIIEIIKKIILQLIELLQELFNLPAWVEKILKLIVGLLEIIENVLPLILELLGIDAAFMKNAERNLLEFHPMWKKLRATVVMKRQ